MTSHRQVELRRWIQEASSTSDPIELEDVLDWPPIDVDPVASADDIGSEPPFIHELTQERPVTSKRTIAVLVVAAAVIAIVAFAVRSSDDNGSSGNDVAANQDEPTATAPPTDETTAPVPSPAPALVATAFWEALATGDREATLGFVDPAAVDSPGPSPFGRAQTLGGQFDWYESVGWEWQLDECVDTNETTAECTASARNSWSDVLGVEPVSGTFIVRFGDGGITDVDDKFATFLGQWSPQVFEIFADWVTENRPDEAAIMFDFDVEINSEILGLYEQNTTRFVEAQQNE